VYHDTIQNGDLMVTGNRLGYNMIQAEQAGMEWLEGRVSASATSPAFSRPVGHHRRRRVRAVDHVREHQPAQP